MNIEEFSHVFISIMNSLMENQSSGKTIYVLSKDSRYMNFRSADYKKVVSRYIEEDEYKMYMQQLRALEWIICHDGRFTNTQFINNKSVRVITVDAQKLKTIKEMERIK